MGILPLCSVTGEEGGKDVAKSPWKLQEVKKMKKILLVVAL